MYRSLLLLLVIFLITACATPAPDPITAEGYAAEEILAYFCDLVFESEQGGQRGSVCKWSTPILCRVHGDYADGEWLVLKDLADQLNAIPGFPGITIQEAGDPPSDDADINIHFVMQSEFKTIFGDGAEHSTGVSRFRWRKNTGEIIHAEIGVAANIYPMNAKASVICEELLQSLGVTGGSYTYPESVFYEQYNGALRPATIDWAILQLLYSNAIPPGTPAPEATATAQTLLGIEN